MSDTPETDAATHDLSDYGPPVPCSRGDWVTADYARKLERERDEWRKKFELSVDAVEIAARLARAESERDEAREALENHTASTIHSCHDQCQRPMCVLRRERDEVTTKLAELSSLAELIVEKATALIARWDQPSWKDTAPTAGFINALRNAVEAYEEKLK